MRSPRPRAHRLAVGVLAVVAVTAALVTPAGAAPLLTVTGDAIEGFACVPFTGVVAHGLDSAQPDTKTATIDWGDVPGFVPALAVVETGALTYDVVGSHTYTAGGTFAVQTKVTRGATTVSTTGVATIEDQRLEAEDGAPEPGSDDPVIGPLTGTEGHQVSSRTLAAFEDSACALPGSYTITIDWGDGTALDTTGTIENFEHSGSDDAHVEFTVGGKHTYLNAGEFTITVTVTRGTESASATNTAQIADPALVLMGQDLSSGTSPASPNLGCSTVLGFTTLIPGLVVNIMLCSSQGTPSSGVVATFTDPGVNEPTSAYAASIDWGDGAGDEPATITGPGPTWSVSGSHQYTSSGSHDVIVKAWERDNPTVTRGQTTSTVVVGQGHTCIISTGTLTFTTCPPLL